MLIVKHRISFWFAPNEKPTVVHVPYDNALSNSEIAEQYVAVAKTRYPNAFKDAAPMVFFPYYLGTGRTPRNYVGDPSGINAFYTTQPVLECRGKYFSLSELPSIED